MSEDDIERERLRVVRAAMELMERRGEEITMSIIASELRIARSRLDVLFPTEGDLHDAVVGEWFAPKLAIMDDVMASDLPPRRKMYEFFARRYVLLHEEFRADPPTFKLYIEMGETHFERARSYIDLADHYLCELIAEAQAEGDFDGLGINQALSMINQMVICYIQPNLIAMLDERLSEAKLAGIIDTIFAGLSAESGGSSGLARLHPA